MIEPSYLESLSHALQHSAAHFITEDCPECDGTGERAQGDACRYCGGRGKLETDVDREAVIGDEKLDIQDADLTR